MTEQPPAALSPDMMPDTAPLQQPSIEVTEQAAHEWGMVSGALLRELDNPDVQAALLPLTTAPVNEELPKTMLDRLPSTPLLDRVRGNATELTSFASLPAVEDERLLPDLTTASPLRGGNSITLEEHKQVAERYRFARDVKLLSLGAELQSLGEARPAPDEDGAVTLPSGIRMVSDPALGEESASLLDPTKWGDRHQLKDRVFTFEANGKTYVLKEEKTARHTDTIESGHQQGLSPAEEFEVGRTMVEKASSEKDGVHVEFERPLGHVEYPDGFKFGVFAYKEGLTTEQNTQESLTTAILENPDKFKEEYEAVAKAVDEEGYKEIRAAIELAPELNRRRLGATALRLLGIPKRKFLKSTLTFEDFAAAKAAQMHITGNHRLNESRYLAGYQDPDTDGTMYSVDAENATLSVVGLDYERYAKITDHVPSADRVAQVMAERHYDNHIYRDAGHSEHSTAMQRAATVALLERDDPRWKGDQH